MLFSWGVQPASGQAGDGGPMGQSEGPYSPVSPFSGALQGAQPDMA